MADVDLVSTLSASPHTFLQPSPAVSAAAIAVITELLDPLAVDIADAQKTRRDEHRRKRKRSEAGAEEPILQLRKVYTNGLGVKQIWEQARRVLDATCIEVERSAQLQVKAHSAETNGLVGEEDISGLEDDEYSNSVTDDQDAMSIDEDLDVDEIDFDEQDDDGFQADSGDEDIEEEEDDESLSDVSASQQETFAPDPNGLNDGFFSIDDFNRQSQFLEQQDARGDDDNPSDEDDIDWDVDPLTMSFANPKGDGKDDAATNNDSDEEEPEGATFGNTDLNAADSDEEMENADDALDDALPGLNNTNEIRYSDFFEPPPKKLSKTKRMRALPKTQPPKQDADLGDDIQRAISDVNRDLFASDEESIGDESGSNADAPKDKNKNLSTHEKQRAKIAAEIRRLEAANVAKRDWTLSGEARAVDRPVNSLIEEDMEFERVGKPVPVITAEVSEEIEQLIKRRILAREFDEVIRRHPDALGNASETRRGRIELNDAKPQSGLAEIYEQEHLQSTDPGYVDNRSAATKKQHAEIDRLWKEVSSQLDVLSNLHFKPKRAEIQIKTVEDKPTISMEDARPVGAGGEESMLAPQEVYRPGEKGRNATGEITSKGGVSVSKEEMTREEKARKRRRQKERNKKAGGGGSGSKVKGQVTTGKKSKAQEKDDILADLRKGGVKVVDKNGEMKDLAKVKRGHDAGVAGGSALKL